MSRLVGSVGAEVMERRRSKHACGQSDSDAITVHEEHACAGETTALGEPKPGPLGRVQTRVVPVPGSAGSSLMGLVAAGAGIGLVFSLLGRIL